MHSGRYLGRGAAVGLGVLVLELAIRTYQQHWIRHNPLPDVLEDVDQRLDWLRQACEDITVDLLTRPNPSYDDE